MDAKDAPGTSAHGMCDTGPLPTAAAGASAYCREAVDAYRMVAEISAEYIDLPAKKLEAHIDTTLEAITDFAEADRACFAIVSRTDLPTICFHQYAAASHEGRFRDVGTPKTDAVLAKLAQIVQREKVVRIQETAQLPESLAEVASCFAHPALRSSLLVAIEGAGAPVGFLALETAHTARVWGEAAEILLRGVGRVLLNALSRKLHVEALNFERSLMSALMENIPDAIYFKDRQSRFTRISRAQARLFGLEHPEQAVGKTDADFFTREHAQQAFRDEQGIIRSGEPVIGKVEKETWPDRAETWVSSTKMPLRDADGEIVGTFGISRDITESKKLAQSLERHARLLSQANDALQRRNQELDEFTYIASHDLQEPLRKLCAFSDLLREDLAAGNHEDIEHDIEVLTGAARRMQRLVQDLLALSRSGRQTINFEPLELDSIVDEALDALELRIAETGATLERAELPRVLGDRTLLIQLYQNLLGNALKFTGKAHPRIGLTVEPDAEGGWLLGVRDDGIGLKPEYAEQIFAPFKRLHGRDEYEGTGVGLAICRKIVERHDGRIWVESELGHGAHFRFTLGKPAPGDTP